MRFALLLTFLAIADVLFLHTLFKPGFVAPDLVLIALLSRAYLKGRESVLWAIYGGITLDLLTDNIGLNLAGEVLSIYILILLTERFLIRNAFTFLIPSVFLIALKKAFSLLLVSLKFSFEVSLPSLIISWFVELLFLWGVYFLYLRRKG